MINVSIKSGFLLSFAIHFTLVGLLFLNYPSTNPNDIVIQPPVGGKLSFQFPSSHQGRGDNSLFENNIEGGTDTEQEVDRFLKSLRYPKSALERGLESDCEWIVNVAEKGKIEILEESKRCKYRVFDTYFREEIQNWDFHLSENTRIRIPVRFRINNNEQH